MKREERKNYKLGVIGCGHMGKSLVRGMVEHGFYPQNLYVFDVDPKATGLLKKSSNVRIAKTVRQLASFCDVVILAVKPQVMDAVLSEISLSTPKSTLVISIAAGISLERLQKGFKEKLPVIRVMPNMPAQIGAGMAAYCPGRWANERHKKTAEEILHSVGQCVEVKESLMDAVTAVSGSGPAYFFLLASKLIEAACEAGLKADVAKLLVVQTALGSAKAMKETDADPEELIAQVASKGGTTEAALKVFQKKGFGKIIHDAVKDAVKRSQDLNRAG